MTGRVTVVDREQVDSPGGRRSRAWPLLALAAVVALGAAAGVAVVGHDTWQHGGGGTATRAVQRESMVAPANSASPVTAVTALLGRRATAIRQHDRAAFAATLDPGHPVFRGAQLAMFAHLARVRFATWSYELGAGVRHRPQRDRAGTFVPASVSLRYRLAGFDVRPVVREQYPTFVERSGRWYLASWSDAQVRGPVSDTDLWDYAPVAVVRRPAVLVLGAPQQRRTMSEIATVVTAAIPRVTAVWGSDWPRRVVVLVPSTEREMGRLDNDQGALGQIAALTSSEISPQPGRPSPAGDRVTINPKIWPRLGELGRSVVLTHELTHVATQSVSGVQTPQWLEEGFADYVGFRQPGVTVGAAAAELATAVRAGHLPRRLPLSLDFRWGGARLAQAYEQGWLACRYIAQRYGPAALVRFYRAVGTSSQGSVAAVDTGLRSVLGLTTAQFTARWRSYVHRELAG